MDSLAVEILIAILLVYGLLVTAGPVIFSRTLRIKGSPKMKELALEDMPPSMQRVYGEAAPTLVAAGFVCRALLAIDSETIGVKSFAALWVAPATRDMATVIATTNVLAPNLTLVGFDTQFADGIRIETSNMKSANAFAPVPHRHRLILSGMRDLKMLYQIHLARLAQHSGTMAEKIIPEAGEDIEYYRAENEAAIREQMELGRWRYVERSDTYRPTFRGACVMTLGQIWPITIFRKRSRRRRALQELSRIGMNAFPVKVA